LKAPFFTVKVASISELNDCTRLIEFENYINASPGQFVMAWLPGIGEKPYSIATMAPFSLLVVDVGPFSHALHILKKGDPLWVKGPLGHGFIPEGRKLLMAAGGYGAAPLFPLAVHARTQDCEVHVCLGARSADGIMLAGSFERIGCTTSIATEDSSGGTQGLVTDLIDAAIGNSIFDTLYACGPVGMLSALACTCKTKQLNYQFSWEANMRCGMGLCGSCEVPVTLDPSLPQGWLACYDGPVFVKRWN
jgi:dihydroorotate dehydrogenase electron transfer subunit